MVTRTTCLQAEQILELLESRLPESEEAEIVRHLDHCDRCRRRLEALSPRDSEFAALDESDPGSFGPAYHQVFEALRQKDFEARENGDTEAEDSLDFLQTSSNPNLMGRFGRYEVSEFLGRGGMGIVMRARDPLLDRIVAIKVLDPRLAGKKNVRLRFEREARAAAAVSHENVVVLHGASERDGLLYLVMQYVPGESLAERIRRDGALGVREILRISTQMASGMAAAHAQGIVHRDIKPANILLEDGFERVRITDFGLAHIIDDASLTQSGLVAGTPSFMSPEHTQDGSIDYRADLFSLGSVMYAMCTGEQPFRGATSLAVMRSVCDDAPRPIREINPAVPRWLVEVISKLHVKNRERRYQSAYEVAELLRVRLANLQLSPDGGDTDATTPEADALDSLPVSSPTWRHLLRFSSTPVLRFLRVFRKRD